MKKTRRWSLSSKITIGLSGLLLGLAGLVTVLTFGEMRREAIHEKQALIDVMNYTFETLLGQEAFPSLQRVVENAATNSELQSIVIVDRAGVVLASSNHFDAGKAAKGTLLREFLGLARWARTTHVTESTVVILQPLRGSSYLGGTEGDTAGVVEVTVALDVLEEQARMAALRLLPIILGGFLALSAGLALLLGALVTKPMGELALVAQRIRSGVTIVGISPRVAQSLVHLRIDFSGIATRANLQSGLVHALRKQNLSIRRMGDGDSSLAPSSGAPAAMAPNGPPDRR